jgi:hypothetical protein
LKDFLNRPLSVVEKQTHFLECLLVFVEVVERRKMRERLHALPQAHLHSEHLLLERLEDS